MKKFFLTVARCHSIYLTNEMKVYEEWLEQLAPGSYSFTWDGRVNVMPPPPNGLAEAGLYVFDDVRGNRGCARLR